MLLKKTRILLNILVDGKDDVPMFNIIGLIGRSLMLPLMGTLWSFAVPEPIG